MDAVNGSIGVQNISINSSVNSTAWSLQKFESELGNIFASQLAGGTQLGGLFALTVMGYMLYRSDVSEDISASVMIPATFFMASEGLLPFGQGVFYAMILAVSGIFIFGLIKYADR